jgi:integrase/recombinase XerD
MLSGGEQTVEAFQARAEAFLEYCRIEKGLSRNSLTAYRRDLARYAKTVRETGMGPATAEAVSGHLDSLYAAGMSARSVARHLTTLRNLFQFLQREGDLTSDPTAHTSLPRQWQTIPKYLGLDEIQALLEGPEEGSALGLRDRAMFSILFASGPRVSELCSIRLRDLNLEMGVLRLTGKGDKQRLVPVGKQAIRAVEAYLSTGRPGLLK